MNEERISSIVGDLQLLDFIAQRRSLNAQVPGRSRLIPTRFLENPDNDSALDRFLDGLERFGDIVADLIRQGFDKVFYRLCIPADI